METCLCVSLPQKATRSYTIIRQSFKVQYEYIVLEGAEVNEGGKLLVGMTKVTFRVLSRCQQCVMLLDAFFFY